MWVLIPSFSSLQHEILYTSLKQKQNKEQCSFEEQCFRISIRNRGRGTLHLWLGPLQRCFLKEGHGTNKRPFREVPCSAPAWAWSSSLSVLSSRSFLRPIEINDSTAYNRRGQECLQSSQIINNTSSVLCWPYLGLVCG